MNYKLGDPNADSYVSTSFANNYFSQRSGSSSWKNLAATGSTTATKQNYLIQATREIDMNNFMGDKYFDSQALQFPRSDHEVFTGACASPGTTYFKGANLWSSTYNRLPTDYFKDGTVHITSGTSKGDTRVIASSNRLTGMVHVASAFTATLDTTSNYLVLAPIHSDIAKAQCEQVLYIMDSGLQKYLEFKHQGISGVSIGDVSVNLQKYGNSPIALQTLGFYARRFLSRFFRQVVRIARQ